MTLPLLPFFIFSITALSAADDSAAMAKLAAALHPKPPKWSASSSSFCEWYGVTCDSTGKFVEAIDLPSMNLSGSLPPEFSSLPFLMSLTLQLNSFSGPIPDFSNCKNLSRLQLNSNQLTGIVPQTLASPPGLKWIGLYKNKLQGPYPKFLLNGSNDFLINMNDNNFCTTTGDPCDPQVTAMLETAGAFGYPSKLSDSWKGNDACNNWPFISCNLRKEIVEIDFGKQNFTGKIAPQLAKLTTLQYLYLNDNNLTGSIPEKLVDLPHLLVLDVSNNNLSGNVPPFKPFVKLIIAGNPQINSSPEGLNGSHHQHALTVASETLCLITGVLFLVYIGCKIVKNIGERSKMAAKGRQEGYSEFFNALGEKEKQLKIKEIKVICFQELVIATDNFHPANKLGQGGFGLVYKGKLQEGQEIAVKRLSHASGQGLEKFINEVLVTSKLQHRNLVRLLACCFDGEEKILVYEYMPNRSLDTFLFDPEKRKLMDWRKRYDIIQGISRGLLYLHKNSRQRIIHRDLKASNILLDEELNPKIADFGNARTFKDEEEQANTKTIVGTCGYMAPEYAMGGQFSEKSDVFSFGVLVLEIVSGRSNTSFSNDDHCSSLLETAWEVWKGGDMSGLIDPEIAEPCFHKEILKCIHVGLLCVQEFVNYRPTMSIVISMLMNQIEYLPTPKPPTLIPEQNVIAARTSNELSCS